MLDYSEILRLPQLGHQSSATLLDHLCKLQIDFAIPVIFLTATTENDSAATVRSTRKDMSCFTVAIGSSESHLRYGLFWALY
jgi:hypothetical protein